MATNHFFELNEAEIRRFFVPDAGRTRLISKVVNRLVNLSSFVLVFLIFFFLLNFPAYFKRLQYTINNAMNRSTTASSQPNSLGSLLTPIDELQTVVNPPTIPAPTPTPLVPEERNNRLVIEKLSIDVPIIWQVSEPEILSKLRLGVAHFAGTALPGQRGNVFLTGHSSNFPWDTGRFNNVFALLDKLEESDEILLTANQQAYRYRVAKKIVVKPTDTSVLQPTEEPILSLMTCTPTGTTLFRLVVQAKQVSPINVESPLTTNGGVLPKVLPAVR